MRKLSIISATLLTALATTAAVATMVAPEAQPHPALAPQQVVPSTFEVVSQGGLDVVEASVVTTYREPGGMTQVFVDGQPFAVGGLGVLVHSGDSGGNQQSYSSSTTVTQLPGGGSRTDIDHGDGSSTTIIHDPAAGNGSSRTTTSHTDSEGGTTTTTTTTDSEGGTTTTTTTS